MCWNIGVMSCGDMGVIRCMVMWGYGGNVKWG